MNLGGPAHQVSILSGRLAERYETLLVAGRVPDGEASAEHLAERHGAKVVVVPSLGPAPSPHDDARALTALVRLIRSFEPDIVHTHTAKAGFLGRLACAAARRRPIVVHTFHGHVLEGYFGPARRRLYRMLERRAARSTDVLVGVSRATVEDLVRLRVAPRDRFRVIPLGLDLTPFLRADGPDGAAVRAEAGVGRGELLATVVGRLAPIKRPELAVRAVARARAAGAPVRLAFVGDGQLRPRVETLAVELGIADAVTVLGYRRETVPVAAASDIALLTSHNEGTPVWLIEAAAAGVPAVATDVGGVHEVVDGTCVRVPRGDVDALSRGLVRLAGDAQRRRVLGERAREHVRERFSAERLVHDIDALYGELLAARAQSGTV